MKFINRHKIILFLRMFFCILLVIIWGIWLTNLPKPEKPIKKQIKTKFEDKKIIEVASVGSTKKSKPVSSGKPAPTATPKVKVVSKPASIKPTPKNEVKIVLKAASTPTKIEAKIVIKPTPSPAIEKKPAPTIKLPEIASATRKALLNNKPIITPTNTHESSNETSLRKEIPIERSHHKPILQKTLEDSSQDNSWLPKYILETKESLPKIENANNNLDQIANQLELTGLIENPNGEKAAIFKNKMNNQTEILKQGQEYLNLKVIEISQDQVTLGNESLNKKYIKTIDSR